MTDFSDELGRAASKFKKAFEARIDSNVPPPNAPSTVKAKGHGLTLRDTFEFRNGIETRVTPDSFEVGAFDPEIAERAFHNEHGTTTIPARPVFGPVYDGPTGQKILDELDEEIADKLMQELEG